MILPFVTQASDYRFAQTGQQITHAPWVSFGISGLVRSTVYYPDGKLCWDFDSAKQKWVPILGIGYPGCRSVFEYDSTRENWVVIMDFEALKYDPAEHQLYLDFDGAHLPIPRIIEVSQTEVEPLRHMFRTITELVRSAIPRNRLDASILTMSLLRRFLEPAQKTDDTVELFRKKIDADETWQKTLEEISRELGCGRDRLRLDFFNRYQIEPNEYRIRRRLQKILNLFATTHLSLKEVAFEVGMRNATH